MACLDFITLYDNAICDDLLIWIWNEPTELLITSHGLSFQPGTIDHAMNDIKALVNQEEDGPIDSIWLMAEWVSHKCVCVCVWLCMS